MYNTSMHGTTGHSPFFLMFGRQAQLPVDLVFQTNKAPNVSLSEYAVELQQTSERAYDKVRQATGAKQQLQKRLYDQRVHGELYQVGDHVWLHTTVLARGNTKKFHHPWTGPYHVVKRLSNSTYRIQLPRNPLKRLVVHFDRLKPCNTGGQPAAAEDPSATESAHTPPADYSSRPGTPRSLPVGAGLKVVEPADVPLSVSNINHHPSSLFQLYRNPAILPGIGILRIVMVIQFQFDIGGESGTYSSK